MVLTLDGNSEIYAHVRSNSCYMICLRHLIRIFFSPNRLFSFMRAQHLQSYHLIQVPWARELITIILGANEIIV